MQENRTFPQSFAYALGKFIPIFAYVLGNYLSIFAYALGKFYTIFAYALGKRTIFAAVIQRHKPYDTQTINRQS